MGYDFWRRHCVLSFACFTPCTALSSLVRNVVHTTSITVLEEKTEHHLIVEKDAGAAMILRCLELCPFIRSCMPSQQQQSRVANPTCTEPFYMISLKNCTECQQSRPNDLFPLLGVCFFSPIWTSEFLCQGPRSFVPLFETNESSSPPSSVRLKEQYMGLDTSTYHFKRCHWKKDSNWSDVIASWSCIFSFPTTAERLHGRIFSRLLCLADYSRALFFQRPRRCCTGNFSRRPFSKDYGDNLPPDKLSDRDLRLYSSKVKNKWTGMIATQTLTRDTQPK